MRRWAYLVSMTMIGAAVVGCGGVAGTGAAFASLIGTWELARQSTDGGLTFVEVDDVFRLAYRDDGTWADTTPSSGRWSATGDQLTVTHDNGDPTRYYLWRVENGGAELRLTRTNFEFFAREDASVSAFVKSTSGIGDRRP